MPVIICPLTSLHFVGCIDICNVWFVHYSVHHTSVYIIFLELSWLFPQNRIFSLLLGRTRLPVILLVCLVGDEG